MSIEIANTIRAQINAIDKRALWAYGAEDFTSIDADSYQSKYFNQNFGLAWLAPKRWPDTVAALRLSSMASGIKAAFLSF